MKKTEFIGLVYWFAGHALKTTSILIHKNLYFEVEHIDFSKGDRNTKYTKTGGKKRSHKSEKNLLEMYIERYEEVDS